MPYYDSRQALKQDPVSSTANVYMMRGEYVCYCRINHSCLVSAIREHRRFERFLGSGRQPQLMQLPVHSLTFS